MKGNNDAVITVRDSAPSARDGVTPSRDSAPSERDGVTPPRDSATSARDGVTPSRDSSEENSSSVADDQIRSRITDQKSFTSHEEKENVRKIVICINTPDIWC